MIFDLEEMAATSPLPVDDPTLDFAEISGIEPFPEISMSDVSGTGEITLHAAEKCATILVNFTRRLTASDFTGFWYSCRSLHTTHLATHASLPSAGRIYIRDINNITGSRIGFATVSNFLMLLLVQAPNASHATRGKYLVDSWLQVLRCQSQSFPLVKLGLARLDAMHWAGLEDTFVLPPHVHEATANFEEDRSIV
jgi:hypothetical protein